MPIIYQKLIKRGDLQKNPKAYYVFGDNNCRVGKGGQAGEMRGEPNAIGIRTKKNPSYDIDAYYIDSEYNENVKNISEDFLKVVAALDQGSLVVYPTDGVGTGLSNLKESAPKTLAFIEDVVLKLFEDYGLLA